MTSLMLTKLIYKNTKEGEKNRVKRRKPKYEGEVIFRKPQQQRNLMLSLSPQDFFFHEMSTKANLNL